MDIGKILGGLSRAISRRIDWELIRNVFEMTKTKRQGVRQTRSGVADANEFRAVKSNPQKCMCWP